MDQVLELIAAREEDYPRALLEARSILLERLDGSPGNGETLSLLAEVQYWLGTHCEDDGAKEEYLAEGVEYGKQAAAAAPDSRAILSISPNSLSESESNLFTATTTGTPYFFAILM